jgi:hypothetical protein
MTDVTLMRIYPDHWHTSFEPWTGRRRLFQTEKPSHPLDDPAYLNGVAEFDIARSLSHYDSEATLGGAF